MNTDWVRSLSFFSKQNAMQKKSHDSDDDKAFGYYKPGLGVEVFSLLKENYF